MRDHELDEDEDWYEDDGELDAGEEGLCPECGAAIFDITDRCPGCGYWLSESDRRATWSGSSKPLWLKLTAVVVLLAFLAGILGGIVALL